MYVYISYVYLHTVILCSGADFALHWSKRFKRRAVKWKMHDPRWGDKFTHLSVRCWQTYHAIGENCAEFVGTVWDSRIQGVWSDDVMRPPATVQHEHMTHEDWEKICYSFAVHVTSTRTNCSLSMTKEIQILASFLYVDLYYPAFFW